MGDDVPRVSFDAALATRSISSRCFLHNLRGWNDRHERRCCIITERSLLLSYNRPGIDSDGRILNLSVMISNIPMANKIFPIVHKRNAALDTDGRRYHSRIRDANMKN